jgi:hypothetical protein
MALAQLTGALFGPDPDRLELLEEQGEIADVNVVTRRAGGLGPLQQAVGEGVCPVAGTPQVRRNTVCRAAASPSSVPCWCSYRGRSSGAASTPSNTARVRSRSTVGRSTATASEIVVCGPLLLLATGISLEQDVGTRDGGSRGSAFCDRLVQEKTHSSGEGDNGVCRPDVVLLRGGESMLLPTDR